MLSEPHIRRFARHILLREVGGTGQARLLGACVRVPRLDEPGRLCALWLARAGVGALSLPEDDSPAPHADGAGLLLAADAGRPLAEAVRERLLFHAPHLRFEDGSEMEADASGGAQAALGVLRALLGLPGTHAARDVF